MWIETHPSSTDNEEDSGNKESLEAKTDKEEKAKDHNVEAEKSGEATKDNEKPGEDEGKKCEKISGETTEGQHQSPGEETDGTQDVSLNEDSDDEFEVRKVS